MKNIEQLVAELADDAKPVNPAPHPYALSLKLTGAAAIYLAVSLAVSGFRPDLEKTIMQPLFLAEIFALLLTLFSTSLSAALLAFPDLHQKRRLAFAPAWIFALFVLVIIFAWRADSPPAPLPVHNFECTISIFMFSALPAVWTFYAMRKYASTYYFGAGSIALLSSFSVGALWLRLHEANDSILHVVEWHYLPMIAAGLLGVWLGRWLLKW